MLLTQQEVIIKKIQGERLGMNIKGGVGGQPGNPLNRSDEGIFISKINSSGAAYRDGRLCVSKQYDMGVIQSHNLMPANHYISPKMRSA